jgi:hypothetical protein
VVGLVLSSGAFGCLIDQRAAFGTLLGKHMRDDLDEVETYILSVAIPALDYDLDVSAASIIQCCRRSWRRAVDMRSLPNCVSATGNRRFYVGKWAYCLWPIYS